MRNGIVIVAHAPLAGALLKCVEHVFPERVASVQAVDVQPHASAEESLAQARSAVARLEDESSVLLLTDVLGATPCNVACKLQAERGYALIAGANVPMLLRTVTYLDEPMDKLVQLALKGGAQGIVQVQTPGQATNESTPR